LSVFVLIRKDRFDSLDWLTSDGALAHNCGHVRGFSGVSESDLLAALLLLWTAWLAAN
jgi:hypothetical protein